jgi:uncharacterized protein YxeA
MKRILLILTLFVLTVFVQGQTIGLKKMVTLPDSLQGNFLKIESVQLTIDNDSTTYKVILNLYKSENAYNRTARPMQFRHVSKFKRANTLTISKKIENFLYDNILSDPFLEGATKVIKP